MTEPLHRNTVSAQAAQVIADPKHAPDQLEAAIEAQGRLVEFHHMCGRMELAREASKLVLQLNLMRTPETVARMERERGLDRA